MSVRQRGADARFVVGTDAANSEAVDLWNCKLIGLKMPHTWTAADLAFKRAVADYNSVSDRANAADNDYALLTDELGNVISIPAAADAEISFGSDMSHRLAGFRHFKLVSWDSGAGAVVNQGADTTVIPLVECC